MRDLDIRLELRAELGRRFSGDIIRGELGLCLGQTRVDLAVVNGHLHGYEIKSDRDTLARFPAQIKLYNRVLDFSTIVCSERHLGAILDRLPDHWGIIEVSGTPERVVLTHLRAPTLNGSQDPLAIAQLLWRDEVAEILRNRDEIVRTRETRWNLWDRLAALPLETLQREVRLKLKERQVWPGG